LLGELPLERFDAPFHRLCELVDRYAVDLSLEIVAELGVDRALAAGAAAPEITEQRGFVPSFLPALSSVLERLTQAGEIERDDGDPPRYRVSSEPRGSDREALRAEALALDPQASATLDLLDAAADAHAEVAAGRGTGESLLLAPRRVQLWLEYFSNRNRHYGIGNEIAAVAAANRLRAGKGLRILEIGGGAGSAAEALLGEIERRGRLADVAAYEFTEPSPFFRRRGERELRRRFAEVPIHDSGFDIDLPAAEQMAAGGFDLVFGVNVAHVARRLTWSLGELAGLLAEGGRLVVGEGFRLTPEQIVPADLVFELFRGFTSVELDALRPRHGFLTPEQWIRTFAAAGLSEIELVPDLRRIRDVYPRFFAGAICGRRDGGA